MRLMRSPLLKVLNTIPVEKQNDGCIMQHVSQFSEVYLSYPNTFNIDALVCSSANSLVVISPSSLRSMRTCLGAGIRQC